MLRAQRAVVILSLTVCTVSIFELMEMGYLHITPTPTRIPPGLHSAGNISRINVTSISLTKSVETTDLRPLQLDKVETYLLNTLKNYLEYCTAHFRVGWFHVPNALPPCPCLPYNLGKYPLINNSTMVVWDISDIEAIHMELLPGGAWKPMNCSARQRVAIIIPYRDRANHLSIFLRYIHPILQRQLLDYRIFVVEQESPNIFNKASLMNIGYNEAKKFNHFDCFIFHDVDLLPEDDRNMYTCRQEVVTHLAPYTDEFEYRITFLMFGAALAITPEQFEKINGFSNSYWGWGGEDEDMYFRVKAAGYKFRRPSAFVSRYTGIKHKRDVGNPVNAKRIDVYKFAKKTEVYKTDGLSAVNSSLYSIVKIKEMHLYTWIYVALNSSKCPVCDEDPRNKT